MLGSDSPAPIKKRIGIFALSSYFFIHLNQGLSAINSDLPFYDTTNVTPIGSYENPIKTYTATFDCIACCRIVTNLGLGQVEVKVNNETVYAQFNASNSIDTLNWVSVPLKKGQTITISGSANDNHIVKVIGIGK